MSNRRLLPAAFFTATAALMVAALACTCGPVSTLSNTIGTAGAIQGTVESAVTAYGPTIEAGLTEIVPTLLAEATYMAEQATLHGPDLMATITAVVATADAGGSGGQTGQSFTQWATMAIASSQRDQPEWSAMQAVGPPNTLFCGDQSTAWSPSTTSGAAWIRVEFALAVNPTELHVYESYNPGAIYRVEAINHDGQVAAEWNGTPEQRPSPCPTTTRFDLTAATSPITAVIIYLNLDTYQNFSEIDAVELVGTIP
nr:hypothetical protein [Anaerolineae bacterium]